MLYYSDMCILMLALFFYFAALMLAEDGGVAEMGCCEAGVHVYEERCMLVVCHSPVVRCMLCADSSCFMIGVGCDGYCCTSCYGYGANDEPRSASSPAHITACPFTKRSRSACVPGALKAASQRASVQVRRRLRPHAMTAITKTKGSCRRTALVRTLTRPWPPADSKLDDSTLRSLFHDRSRDARSLRRRWSASRLALHFRLFVLLR